jgi:hypothetical protein
MRNLGSVTTAAIVVAAIGALTSCNGKESIWASMTKTIAEGPGITFQPPIIPIEISVDLHGGFQVKIAGHANTPFGSFAFEQRVYSEADKMAIEDLEMAKSGQFRDLPGWRLPSRASPDTRLLAVRVDRKLYYYELKPREARTVEFKSMEGFRRCKQHIYPNGDILVELDSMPQRLVHVRNALTQPVRLRVNGFGQDNLAGGETADFPVNGFPVRIEWTIVKRTRSDGRPIGDTIRGAATVSADGDEGSLTITSSSGSVPCFNLVINNFTEDTCSVVVNEGWPIQNDPRAEIRPGMTDLNFGYYQLSELSNVTIHCGDRTWFWGVTPANHGRPLGGGDEESGRMVLNNR